MQTCCSDIMLQSHVCFSDRVWMRQQVRGTELGLWLYKQHKSAGSMCCCFVWCCGVRLLALHTSHPPRSETSTSPTYPNISQPYSLTPLSSLLLREWARRCCQPNTRSRLLCLWLSHGEQRVMLY